MTGRAPARSVFCRILLPPCAVVNFDSRVRNQGVSKWPYSVLLSECSRQYGFLSCWAHRILARAITSGSWLKGSGSVRSRSGNTEIKKAGDTGTTRRFRKKRDRNTADILKPGGGSVSQVALIGNAILPCYAANPPFEFTRQCQFSTECFPPLHEPDLSVRARPGSAVTITMIGWSRTQSYRI
jgi:hypothetical protein